MEPIVITIIFKWTIIYVLESSLNSVNSLKMPKKLI